VLRIAKVIFAIWRKDLQNPKVVIDARRDEPWIQK